MRMSIRTLAAVAIFAAGWVVGADNTVKEVKVRVLDQFGTEASDVLSFCSVKVGAEVSQEALSKDVRSLLDTGRYGYAGVELEKVADGVNVVYVIKRRYRFQGPLAIKGADYFSESKIRKLSELKSGDYIDDPVLSTKAGKIRDEYVKKYFPSVKIGAEIKPIEGSAGSANVVFTIVEGERAKIHKFLFKGNTSIPEEDLRSSFGQRPWYDPRGWFTDTPVSAQDLEDARSQAEEVYKDHGFLDAKVATPVWEKIGKEKANVVFEVTEGDVYNVESTAIRGVKLFPEAEVLGASKLKANDLAGRKAIDDLVDATPPRVAQKIAELLRDVPNAVAVRRVRVRRSGPVLFVDLTLVAPADVPLSLAHAAADVAEARVRAAYANADVVVHVEPDVELPDDPR